MCTSISARRAAYASEMPVVVRVVMKGAVLLGLAGSPASGYVRPRTRDRKRRARDRVGPVILPGCPTLRALACNAPATTAQLTIARKNGGTRRSMSTARPHVQRRRPLRVHAWPCPMACN
jgi:hypothetical protein